MASSGGIFSSPDELEKWYDGVQLYDAGEMQQSIDKFLEVRQCSKMLFNVGCCYLITNKVDLAAQNYEAAIGVDSHMAVSYFMNGLIYFLKSELDRSFEYFDKARAALRGNKYIDYTQLGLSYKLYACEVMTNQASVLCKQNNPGKAKELLLMANTLKAEKRHDIISQSLDMLQAGHFCSMRMFTLPKHIIYRPSQKLISQLKKKDYLGKSKVLASQNTEEIYACFSGLKAKKDVQVPNHVREKDVKTMLTDIKRKESKGKLRRMPLPPQKKLPPLVLGRVIDTTENINTSPKLPRKSIKPILADSNSVPVQNGLASKGQSSTPPPRRPPLPHGCNSMSLDRPDVNINRERGDRVGGSPVLPRTRTPPAKPPRPLLNRMLEERGTANDERRRSSTCPAKELVEKRPSKELVEKRKVPTPVPRRKNNSTEDISNPSNELLGKVKPPLPKKINGHHDEDNSNKWQNKSPGKKVHEVEICYTFTHKIKLKDGLSLKEVQNILEAQPLPDNIHMCTTGENGELQQLTEQTLQNLLQSNSRKKEIFCTTHGAGT